MAALPEICEALDLTPQRVNQLAKEGVLPREGRGKYDLVACLRAYVRYLQNAVQSKASMTEDGEVVTTKNAKAQLTQYQAEIKKLELAQRRGSVIAIADHESILSTLIIEAKAGMNAIPARVAPKVLGVESRLMVQAIIDAEVKAVLVQLAKRTPALARADHAQDSPTSKTKAKSRTRKKATKRTAKKATVEATA